jgi:hypothetical protein
MTAAERRVRIHAGLATGKLPRKLPLGERAAPRDLVPGMRVGPSTGGLCSGCGTPITRGETICDFTYPDGTVITFHDECEAIWEEERRALEP